MNIEDIKKINALDKEKFYLFRIGLGEWSIGAMKRFKGMCKDNGIQGILIEANDFEAIQIDEKTHTLIRK